MADRSYRKRPRADWPAHIEGHIGPKGGELFTKPGHPGCIERRYIREDIVKDMVADGNINFDFHMSLIEGPQK